MVFQFNKLSHLCLNQNGRRESGDQQRLPYTAKSLLGKSINETFIPFLKGFSDIVWSFCFYYTVWFFPYINTNGLATSTFTTYSYHYRLGEIENG